MDIETLVKIYNKFKHGESLYNMLMQRRIKRILLITSFYNAFIIEEESKFSDQIIGGYHQYNLTSIPIIKNALNASHALKILEQEQFDLIISTLRIGEPSPFELSKIVKEKYPSTLFVILFTESFDLRRVKKMELDTIDNMFLWTGESSLFLSIIKSFEDKMNAENDTKIAGVSVILLIEDSISFYSLYLPELYNLLMKHTQRLIKEEANNDLKYLRMRTRPKILHAKTFEEAKELFNFYKDYILAVITDIELGEFETAGLEIVDFVKKEDPYIPILVQSANSKLLKIARDKDVWVSHKNTPFLLSDLNRFLTEKCGFGDFIFRDKDGNQIAVAKTFAEFEKILSEIPLESFEYHAKRKEFCTWLIPRRELILAKKIRKIKKERFDTVEKHRKFLLNVVRIIKRKNQKGKILNFNGYEVNNKYVIYKIGEGALGGKGRGISFLNALFVASKIERKFRDTLIQIPHTIIISTDLFDEFMYDNNLYYIDPDFYTDDEIKRLFLDSSFPEQLEKKLKKILNQLNGPLMVRSSSLLEDSQFHPFAGIYKSFIIPNCSDSFEIRLKQLKDAIKLVYASVYSKEAAAYVKRLGLKVEEEKMAVVIQKAVGNTYENYFYPHFAGVAQSINYYPLPDMDKNDGIVSMALGLGKYVVEGEKCFRFSPRHPKIRYLSDEEMLKNSQRNFFALDLNKKDSVCINEESYMVKLSIKTAEKHGTLSLIASTYDIENQRIEPGVYGKGPRIINFDNILLYEYFPLAEIFKELLSLSEYAIGTPVEMEFAATIDKKLNLSILQVRPISTYEEINNLSLDDVNTEDIIIYTEKGLGNGIIKDIKYIVFIDPELFDKTLTIEMKKEINEINKILREIGEDYILIGPGRWGSRDRFLGIPVKWEDIDMVKTVVETGIKDFDVEPSQGTHFIHNIISMNIGYFYVPFYSKENFINWNWLRSNKPVLERKFAKVLSFEDPLFVIMDGKNSRYAILKESLKNSEIPFSF